MQFLNAYGQSLPLGNETHGADTKRYMTYKTILSVLVPWWRIKS
jgi:hypothetical protein